MYTVHSRSHYTGLLWSVVRADYSNNTPLTHTCMERETGTVVGGAAGQRRDEVTERSMAGPSLESSPGQTDTQESDYCGHPFTVSWVFTSTYHEGSAHLV